MTRQSGDSLRERGGHEGPAPRMGRMSTIVPCRIGKQGLFISKSKTIVYEEIKLDRE